MSKEQLKYKLNLLAEDSIYLVVMIQNQNFDAHACDFHDKKRQRQNGRQQQFASRCMDIGYMHRKRTLGIIFSFWPFERYLESLKHHFKYVSDAHLMSQLLYNQDHHQGLNPMQSFFFLFLQSLSKKSCM